MDTRMNTSMTTAKEVFSMEKDIDDLIFGDADPGPSGR